MTQYLIQEHPHHIADHPATLRPPSPAPWLEITVTDPTRKCGGCPSNGANRLILNVPKPEEFVIAPLLLTLSLINQ
jgi:hypothetical protein